jgi:hypothetical protein
MGDLPNSSTLLIISLVSDYFSWEDRDILSAGTPLNPSADQAG